MSKTIIVSNRLPLQVKIEGDDIAVVPSIGGLATGMKSVHAEGKGLWVGWSGIKEDELNEELEKKVDKAVRNAHCVSVSLNEEDLEKFYFGFSNRALWPLFHYFMEYAEFEKNQWESYVKVNKKFAEVVLSNIEDDDVVWVHDYQLLLLPQMIREVKPDVKIGFFLHIPFPSYEIFRTFPWREELLTGILGADLVGFHTYDYERHFLSSVRRILRLEVKFNDIIFKDRIVKVDSFPMGIDYKKFEDAAEVNKNQREEDKSELQKKLDEHIKSSEDSSLILSIDRMDYTKGIPNRIRAFEHFLIKYPEFKEKVRLVMLAVPSRSNVPQYQLLKRETDELVGRINGQFATVSWTPIWYFYRSMPFENLIDLYTSSDVALITPIRDGMNLVAKEYVATRTDQDGVLILSEMAGASKEMNEALLINPNNFEEIADAIKTALEMPKSEQQKRMSVMQERLRRYTVERWAEEFLKSLNTTNDLVESLVSERFSSQIEAQVLEKFNKAKNRLMFLDYDGTLVGFKNDPKDAFPDEDLYNILDKISSIENTDLVVISGRDHETFNEWFADKTYNLVTDHGVWLKKGKSDWEALEHLKSDWMEHINPILEAFVDRTPGTFIERKKYSLAWHYRKVDPELGQSRSTELTTVLNSLLSNHDLNVLQGNKVIEIKSSNVNKGRAAAKLVSENEYDFIFAIGDDWTDEYMFEELPDDAVTIKVGIKKTAAKYYIKNPEDVRSLLTKFTKIQ